MSLLPVSVDRCPSQLDDKSCDCTIIGTRY